MWFGATDTLSRRHAQTHTWSAFDCVACKNLKMNMDISSASPPSLVNERSSAQWQPLTDGSARYIRARRIYFRPFNETRLIQMDDESECFCSVKGWTLARDMWEKLGRLFGLVSSTPPKSAIRSSARKNPNYSLENAALIAQDSFVDQSSDLIDD